MSENGSQPGGEDIVDRFEFDPEELEMRPRCIVAIYGGPTWSVLDDYEAVRDAIAEAAPNERIELNACQDDGLPPTQIQINPSLVSTVFCVTEDRWKVDRAKRAAAEAQMRQAAVAGGGTILPPPPGGGRPRR